MAEKSERRVELLLGKKVHAADGRVVGRIEELRAERENNYWVVTEFHLDQRPSSNGWRYVTSGSRYQGACMVTVSDGIRSICRIPITCG